MKEVLPQAPEVTKLVAVLSTWGILGKRDSIHYHLLEAISETATVLKLRQKLLYSTPSGLGGGIKSFFRDYMLCISPTCVFANVNPGCNFWVPPCPIKAAPSVSAVGLENRCHLFALRESRWNPHKSRHQLNGYLA